MNRLMITPGLRRLWRGDCEIQFGLDPARAIVIHLVDPSHARLFDLLDGVRSERGVLRDAAALGIGSRDAFELLTALRDAGLVASAGTFLPESWTGPVRARLTAEAASISVTGRDRVLSELTDAGAFDQQAARALPSPPADGSAPIRHFPANGLDMLRPGNATAPQPPRGSERIPAQTDGETAEPRAPGPSGSATAATATPRSMGSTPTAAEALRRRAAASVLLTGDVRLVVPLAATLAAAGVGHVDTVLKGEVVITDATPGGLSAADVGKARGTTASAAIMRVAPEADTRRLRDGTATFVVQAGARAPAQILAHGLARRRLPHLLIEERDASILVGPLVIPGRTPCLNCVDLHRRDRDEAWQALSAQIATAPEGPGTTAVSTVMIATGVAAAQVLGHLDGIEVEAVGGSIEIAPPAQIRRRSWAPHPACNCVRRPGKDRRQS
jgi:hypothetical protein